MQGVRMLANAVRRHGAEIEVLSLDAPDADFIDAFPAKVHALGPSMGGYGYNSKAVPWLRANAGNYDAVVVNGLWQYHGLAAWRALAGGPTPYFVFTHGMLDPWFKRTYPLKHLKKWLYWPWAEYRVLRDAKAVIFTCEEERLLARESFWLYKVNEVVSSYGTADVPGNGKELAAAFLVAHPQLQGKRIALYLSRIHEKKGCDLLIKAFAKVASQRTDLHLVMAGPDQTGWVDELKSIAVKHGVADRIAWPGMLSGDMKWGAFHASEVFCLPSHQENFGIVVAEALACGKPVLISDKVNIWREIEADRAGVVRPDTLEGTLAGLEQWLAMSPVEMIDMSVAARHCFESRFRIEQVAADLLQIIGSHVPERARVDEARVLP
ncbi:glycosyltransferase [Lysobacter tyrosinilyticus]